MGPRRPRLRPHLAPLGVRGGGYNGKTYNRLVSSVDGHSAKWLHENSYDECQDVCAMERVVSPEVIEAAVETLRNDTEMADVVAQLPKSQLTQIVSDFSQLGWFRGVKDEAIAKRITDRLTAMDAEGKLGGRAQAGGLRGLRRFRAPLRRGAGQLPEEVTA
ncbi:MAG: hypothetical protein H6730_05445 [Deltaproteobacteria bacterium]|nr:hypothetical protein [Deltaproteobacteria bacterium]